MDELEQFSDGSTAYAGGFGEDAWHLLGTTLPGGLTAEDVMEFAHLGDWNVRKAPVSVSILGNDGVTTQQITGKYVNLRTNPVSKQEEIIGESAGYADVVGERYHPFQNEGLTDYLQTLTDESGAYLDTAGSMRGGADVFVTMKLPKTMLVGGVDPVNTSIALLNNHTGNRAITALITPVRIVCSNTQRAALREASASFKIRHTETAGDRIQLAREQLGLTWKYLDKFEAEAEKMIQEQLSEAAFRKVCDEIWKPLPASATDRSKTIAANRALSLQQLFLDADTNANIRGTRWAGYQAVTEYLDHHSPVNGKTPADKAINRAARTIDGSVVEVKERAFAVLSVGK